MWTSEVLEPLIKSSASAANKEKGLISRITTLYNKYLLSDFNKVSGFDLRLRNKNMLKNEDNELYELVDADSMLILENNDKGYCNGTSMNSNCSTTASSNNEFQLNTNKDFGAY